MKKENDKSTGFVVCVIILLVIGSVICLICANCMSSNEASIMGGVLSVAATTLLGVIAVWQNKKYKELADEKSRQAEELMFTPECRLLDVRYFIDWRLFSQIDRSRLLDARVNEKMEGIKGDYCLHFAALNLPMIDIRVGEINYREKGDPKHERNFPLHSTVLYNTPITIFNGEKEFYIREDFPSEFLNVDTICRVTLSYKNIYDSVVHKTVEFERSANGNTRITKQERAILIGKNVEDANHADA